ncbi:MAG TPA: GNAT family N-acetyltransferase [Hyphomicrobiaceae bacterium]|jgi:ribosomal protein S18 acetylase RimI-like enzyme
MSDSDAAVIGWATDPAEILALGAFFARNAVTLPDYISHGEVQFGLSRDGATWDVRAPDLVAAYFAQIADGQQSAKVVGAWLGNGRPVAVAVVDRIEREGLRYAVLCDILVEKDRRHAGLGERMVRLIEADMRAQRVDWIFLESGVRNARAHRFFGRLEYREVSRVFAKRLSRGQEA